MKDSIHELREDLTQFQALLGRGSFLSFTPGERELLRDDASKLLLRLEGVAETFLTVGLLGGTGVGKSSIMNGLAGSEIASTSHRRPHTDQVLIYRHGSAVLPAALQNARVPWRDITHHVDGIRQILLCDLPDFDSLEGEHRESVLRFLEHLDVLVWVTSPEKYADGRFYDFVREVPKARGNFYFVLNKVDLLFEERSLDIGFDQLAGVTGSFQRHLAESGVQHPLIYTVSAREAFASAVTSLWNQFSSFRHQVFQHRDTKEIMAIKAANLDVEVRQFMLVLEKEAGNVRALQSILREFAGRLDEERPEWARSGGEVIGDWLATHFDREAFFVLDDPIPLAGPGYGIAVLNREWRKLGGRDAAREVFPGICGEKAPLSPLKRKLAHLEDQLAHSLLRQGLPTAVTEHPERILDADKEWEGFYERFQRYLGMRLAGRDMPSLRAFRSLQYAAYFILFAFFLIAVGGESSWADLFQHPSLANLGALISSIILNLFSPAGFAGLGSYVLLNVFLGFRFYRRYKKTLQGRAQKFIESLKLEAGEIWEEQLGSIRARLNEYDLELESRMSIIAGLRGSHGERSSAESAAVHASDTFGNAELREPYGKLCESLYKD